MRFVIAGEWASEIHEEALASALEQLGHEVCRFQWGAYWAGNDWAEGHPDAPLPLLAKLQRRLLAGPAVRRLNEEMCEVVLAERPDGVFVYRGTPIFRRTLQSIRKALPAVLLIGYNNDDPFAIHHSTLLWRHFMECIPAYDLLLAYRPRNLKEFEDAGARRVELLRSWYLADQNFPIELSDEDRLKYQCDVVFVGHYEPDGRDRTLDTLLREGFDLRVFGPEWHRAGSNSRLDRLRPIIPVRGLEYTKAIRAAKIALCFLSKANRDSYTRRCFEIPAVGTMLLSEFSDDLATLFVEGREAEFFRSAGELVSKLRAYLGNEQARSAVAGCGRMRVIRDGHDSVSRARQLVAMIECLRIGSEAAP